MIRICFYELFLLITIIQQQPTNQPTNQQNNKNEKTFATSILLLICAKYCINSFWRAVDGTLKSKNSLISTYVELQKSV